MRTIDTQATNNINIVGKLISTTFRKGNTSAGKPYESVTLLVRVTQEVEGQEIISEIPVSIFASQYTNSGALNPLFDNVQKAKNLKTAQEYGIDEADTVRLSRANLQENFYVANNGQFYDGWQIRGAFCSIAPAKVSQIASFNLDLFLLDMHDDIDADGDPTGKLIIKGGIVGYGGHLDVLEFIVESPDKVEYLQRNWNINDTVHACGRIVITSEESNRPTAVSSWGESIVEQTTRTVRKLIITGGSDEALEEDMCYDPTDIKKAFNARKAIIEQKQIEARNSGAKKNAPSTKTARKYDWE